MSSLVLPVNSWVPVTPEIVSDVATRSPEIYHRVVRQFPVESHVRWMRGHMGGKETYCNIFVWDCTLALGCEIPHWVDDFKTGNRVNVGKGVELDGNATCAWLENHGPRHGWRMASIDEAIDNAKQGRPSVVTFLNPKGTGHIAMLLPDDPAPRIAQAGAKNFYNEPMVRGFGKYPTKYFVHS